VTAYNSNTLTKLRAADGATLATFTVIKPNGIAFDGANIWVSNQIGNTVTKLRASDGSVLGVFPVGNFPQGVTFDGSMFGLRILVRTRSLS
jgi:hypothetical protein